MRVRVGHSPDPDDAFMYWAIAAGRVDTRGHEFEHVVPTSRPSTAGRSRVAWRSRRCRPAPTRTCATATPCCRTAPRWATATARWSWRGSRSSPPRWRAAGWPSPGRLTTAFLVRPARAARVRGRCSSRSTRSSTRVAAGDVDAGVVIHEGQLGWQDAGPLAGASTSARGGWPRPACRCRSAPSRSAATCRRTTRAEVSAVLREAIDAGLEHRAGGARLRPATSAAASTPRPNDRFVGMYVNDLTRDYGPRGREGVAELIRRGAAIGAFAE